MKIILYNWIRPDDVTRKLRGKEISKQYFKTSARMLKLESCFPNRHDFKFVKFYTELLFLNHAYIEAED